MADLKTGAVVQQAHGGPKMTIGRDPKDDPMVFCQWFGGGKLNEKLFPRNTLKLLAE